MGLMKQLAWRAVFLLAILGAALSAQAVDTCANRNVTVNVRDRQGNLITALPPSSFLVTQNGKPISVASADMEVGPRVVLLLDVSGSMILQLAKWQTATLVTEHVVQSSRNNFRVALVLFASEVIETLDFSHSGSRFLREYGDWATVKTSRPRGNGELLCWMRPCGPTPCSEVGRMQTRYL